MLLICYIGDQANLTGNNVVDLLYMYTLDINQSNVLTKLRKHDFVIPEIEVTSQLIDMRSSATLC